MKNLSLILNLILATAVSILFYLHFSKKNLPETLVQPTIPGENSSFVSDTVLKTTAYINTDTLFEKFTLVKDLRDELAAEKLKSESKYENEMKKLEKEVMEFREKAQYLTQQEGEKKQMELMEKEQKLMKLERDLSSKLADLEIEKNKQIQKAVYEYLETINKEKNYAYIFGYNGTGNVLYANSKFDITNEIINGLNEEYKSKKVAIGSSGRQ